MLGPSFQPAFQESVSVLLPRRGPGGEDKPQEPRQGIWASNPGLAAHKTHVPPPWGWVIRMRYHQCDSCQRPHASPEASDNLRKMSSDSEQRQFHLFYLQQGHAGGRAQWIPSRAELCCKGGTGWITRGRYSSSRKTLKIRH